MYEDEIPVERAEDLRGKKFNKLTVLYRVKNINKKTAWKCQCDCGNFISVRADALKSGHTTSCGCNHILDLTNKKFNKLTALYPTNKRSSNSIIWHCICDCGNFVDVQSTHLQSGHTQSCGCLQKEKASNNAINLKNMKFEYLTVLEATEKRKGRSVVWKCLCKCGNIHFATTHQLMSKQIQSCGCIISKGESKINELLREKNILFETQKTFESCRFNDTRALARFDFYIDEKYLIEFDGIQHFEYKNKGWNTKENFEKTQERDEYKNQWCKENNIPLIRIPYTKLDTLCIEDLLLETTQFRIV